MLFEGGVEGCDCEGCDFGFDVGGELVMYLFVWFD